MLLRCIRDPLMDGLNICTYFSDGAFARHLCIKRIDENVMGFFFFGGNEYIWIMVLQM